MTQHRWRASTVHTYTHTPRCSPYSAFFRNLLLARLRSLPVPPYAGCPSLFDGLLAVALPGPDQHQSGTRWTHVS